MIVLFVDNLFFYPGGQSVSCKASLAALRLYGFLWYCCGDVLSKNKYDDDDDTVLRVYFLVGNMSESKKMYFFGSV